MNLLTFPVLPGRGNLYLHRCKGEEIHIHRLNQFVHKHLCKAPYEGNPVCCGVTACEYKRKKVTENNLNSSLALKGKGKKIMEIPKLMCNCLCCIVKTFQ